MTINKLFDNIIKKYNILINHNGTIKQANNFSDIIGNPYINEQSLLNGNAKGTIEKDYLDPIPELNKLGEAYADLAMSINNKTARTDPLKMNRKFMDYTNDGITGESLYNLEITRALDINGDGVIGYDDANLLLSIYAYQSSGINNEVLFNKIFDNFLSYSDTTSLQPEDTDLGKEIVDSEFLYLIGVYPERFISKDSYENSYYREVYKGPKLFLYNNEYKDDLSINEWEQVFLDKINIIINNFSYFNASIPTRIISIIDKKDDYYITYEEAAQEFGFYSKSYYLNLLMPQYARRVEVEDLNENFWVIGNVLDAVVNTLYSHNGILNTVIKLVKSNIYTTDTINAIIKYLNEMQNQIDILNKTVGIGKVKNINWSYNSNIESKISFYENVNLADFKIELINDYGTRKINFPIGNSFYRNGFSYERLISNSENLEEEYLNLFFSDINNLIHDSVENVFDKISKLKKSQLPIEVLLWRQYIGDISNIGINENNCCMASYVREKFENNILNANNKTKLLSGHRPYLKDNVNKNDNLIWDDIAKCDGQNGYYYGLPKDFDVILYDTSYYDYIEKKLVVKDIEKISNFINDFNDSLNNLNKPILFIPSSDLYNGEVICINLKNICLQDQVPLEEQEFNSSYWFTPLRFFYKSSRDNSDSITEENNKISIYYLDKNMEFEDRIKKDNNVPVTLLCTEKNKINNISQYTILENLDYKHYYNIAALNNNVTCYGYAGYYEAEGTYDNTSVGILTNGPAYSSVSNFYQKGSVDNSLSVYDYIDTYDPNKTNINIFDLFKNTVRDQTGEQIQGQEKNNYLPFISFGFKITNFPFFRKNYINSIKVNAESSQIDWFISAPTRFAYYTLENEAELGDKNVANRSLVYTDGAETNPLRREITYKFTELNNIFDDSIFIGTTDWRENYRDMLNRQDNINNTEYIANNIVPRIVGLSFFGKGSLGAPGVNTPHF